MLPAHAKSKAKPVELAPWEVKLAKKKIVVKGGGRNLCYRHNGGDYHNTDYMHGNI